MTGRVAVATARFGDPWDELAVLAERLAGALACVTEVDVLVPVAKARSSSVGWDGASRVLSFPGTAAHSRRREAWRSVALGMAGDEGPGQCTCVMPPLARLPAPIEEQLVLAEGGDSSELYEHLRTTRYDAVVFVGLHSPVACFGIRFVPDDEPVFVAPGAWDACIGLQLHADVLARADRILVSTDFERASLGRIAGAGVAGRIESVRFVVGVNAVVRPSPLEAPPESFVVVARDWRTPLSVHRYRPWAESLARSLPSGVELRLVGPGASALTKGVVHAERRIDAWWWMSRALAVVDLTPHRVIGQETLEAMLLGVPIVVAADGGATREHAEAGNGGLWVRADDQLVASVEALRDDGLRVSLGEQGRFYAEGQFGDRDTYVKRVADTVLAADQ